jgi:hypothetical protein
MTEDITVVRSTVDSPAVVRSTQPSSAAVRVFAGGVIMTGSATALGVEVVPEIPELSGATNVQEALVQLATAPIDGGTFF